MDVTSAFSAAMDPNALGVQIINNMRGAAVAYTDFAAKVAEVDTTSVLGSMLPEPTTDDEAVTRVTTLGRGFTRDQRFDKVKRKGGEAVWTFNERVHTKDEARWEVRGELRYVRAPGAVNGSLDTFRLPREAGVTARSAFAFYRQHLLTEDLTAFSDEVFRKCGSVSLRDSGGVYFIPRSGLETANVLVNVLRALLGKGAVGVINIPDDGEGGDHRSVVQSAAQDEFQKALEDAKAAAQQYVNDLTLAVIEPGRRGPQPRSMTSRLLEVRALIDKVRLYADLLHMKQDDVLTTANQLESFWRDSLGIPQ